MRRYENTDQALDASILAALRLLDLEETDTPPSVDSECPADTVELVSPQSATTEARARAFRSISGNRSNRATVEGELHAKAVVAAKLHGLPVDLAVAVAAGRMTVNVALAARNVRTRNAQVPEGSGISRLIALSMVIVVVVGLGLYVRSNWLAHVASVQESAPRSGRAPEPLPEISGQHAAPETDSGTTAHTAVSRAAGGDVVRVEGPNPRAVMDSYCEASLACSPGRQPAIASAALNSPGVRIGIYRNAADPTRESAVYIHRDPRSHRWAVGDGRRIRVVDPSRTARLRTHAGPTVDASR